MTKKGYSEMLKSELLAAAQRLGLTNLGRLRKDEIIDLIKRAARKQGAAATGKPTSAKEATPTKKAPTKKAPAKKATAKKATAKKTTAKKATAKKAVTKKAPTKKAPAKPPAKKEADAPKRARTYRAPAVTGETTPRSGSPGPVSPQADAVATKYMTSEYKPEELQGVDEGLPELPESHGDNRIVLLPRDPAWLFAYWNLTYEYKEAARAAGGRVLALRLFDVTDVDFDGSNAHAGYEHECAEWARSWYLPVPAPGREYIVEIGYRGGEEWYPLARSKRVAVPSDQPSTWVQSDFVTIGFDEDLLEVRDRLPEGPGPAEAPAALPMTQTIFDDGDLRILVGGPFFNPSGVPGWPLFSHALMAGELAGSVQLPGSLGQLPGSLGQLPGSLGQLPGSLGQLPHLAGSLGLRPGVPLGAPGALGTELDGRLLAGEPVTLENATQPMLQAAVELVVSGRSYPGTEISIAGRPIPVGPDGAFSLRVSVPEGLRDLPIEARAVASGVTRRLVLKLGRDFE